jgi:hypothetical protein
MTKVVYISKSTIERKRGPLRTAHLPGESQPVAYRLRYLGDGWLNDGHFRRRSGSASN